MPRVDAKPTEATRPRREHLSLVRREGGQPEDRQGACVSGKAKQTRARTKHQKFIENESRVRIVDTTLVTLIQPILRIGANGFEEPTTSCHLGKLVDSEPRLAVLRLEQHGGCEELSPIDLWRLAG